MENTRIRIEGPDTRVTDVKYMTISRSFIENTTFLTNIATSVNPDQPAPLHISNRVYVLIGNGVYGWHAGFVNSEVIS